MQTLIFILCFLILWTVLGPVALLVLRPRPGEAPAWPQWRSALIGGPVLWYLEFTAWRAEAKRARDRMQHLRQD